MELLPFGRACLQRVGSRPCFPERGTRKAGGVNKVPARHFPDGPAPERLDLSLELMLSLGGSSARLGEGRVRGSWWRMSQNAQDEIEAFSIRSLRWEAGVGRLRTDGRLDRGLWFLKTFLTLAQALLLDSASSCVALGLEDGSIDKVVLLLLSWPSNCLFPSSMYAKAPKAWDGKRFFFGVPEHRGLQIAGGASRAVRHLLIGAVPSAWD